jgi:serine protease
VRRFGLPRGYEGTSMAAPHVSGAAALVMATGRLGRRNPTPAEVERHLEATTRDLGAPGFDRRYGNGLLDVAAALR